MQRAWLVLIFCLLGCGRTGLLDFGSPKLSAAPRELDLGEGFPAGPLLTGEVTLTSVGRVDVGALRAEWQQASRGLFTVEAVPATLKWDQSVTLKVTYQPTLPPRDDVAQLLVTSNALPITIAVRARTLDPCNAGNCKVDGNSPCVSDARCVAGVCVKTPRTGAACTDDNACTLNDACDAQGECVGQPVVCDMPPATVCFDANRLATYSTGSCTPQGQCLYEPMLTTCPFGCRDNRCFDPCAGVTCNTPPSQCHEMMGECVPQLPVGTCRYDLEPGKACTDGNSCSVQDTCNEQGACVGQPMVCNRPPGPRCVDEDHSEVYEPMGVCVAGTCNYTQRTDFCDIACLRGQCMVGCNVSLVAGSGVDGFREGAAAQARFSTPYGLAVDSNNDIYVNDTGNGAVRLIRNGQVSTPAGASNLPGPHDVALDGAGGLLVGAQGGVIRIANGMQQRIAGNGVGGPAVDGPALSAGFGKEVSVLGSSADTVYVADADNHSIRLLHNGQVTTFAGTGAVGWVDGPNLSAQFSHPHELAFLGNDLIVPDALTNTIRRLSSTTTTTVAGDGTPGMLNGPLAQARFNTPLDVGVDPQGAIYVADSGNSCIRRISSTRVTTFAGVCGASGYQEGNASQARFSDPAGVFVTRGAVFFISDMQNNRVRRIDCFAAP